MHFADHIHEVCLKKKSRLVVGLDPHWDLIPETFKKPGLGPGRVIGDFLSGVVGAVVQHAVALKPQIAFFEQFGVEGLKALTRVLETARSLNATVIMDAKRNDIGSTAAAYARAFFAEDRSGFPADALTVNAYLGEDGIRPFLQYRGKGLFVLVKTSNPSSGEFQDLRLEGGGALADRLAMAVRGWNEATIGESGYGNVGAVIGATYPEHMAALRTVMPRSIFLVPGYGAQGGSADAIRAAFNPDGLGALINSSRAVLFPADANQSGFKAVADAAEKAKDQINGWIA